MSGARRILDLIRSLDDLYQRVVTEPQAWDDAAYADWLETALGNGEALDRTVVKVVQRGVRRARRLQRYWEGREDGPSDWRVRVDETLGSAGWRPGLELAEWGMAADPDPELFAVMAERFRAVNFAPFPATFEEWQAGG